MTSTGSKKTDDLHASESFLASSLSRHVTSSSTSEDVIRKPEVDRCETPPRHPSSGVISNDFGARSSTSENESPYVVAVNTSPPIPPITCPLPRPQPFVDRISPAASPHLTPELNVEAGLAPSPCATGFCDPGGSNSSSILRKALPNVPCGNGGNVIGGGAESEQVKSGIPPVDQPRRQRATEQRIVDCGDIYADVSAVQLQVDNENKKRASERGLRRRRSVQVARDQSREGDQPIYGDDYTSEWYSIARVLDRMFLVVFVTADVVITTVLLVVYPNYAPTLTEPIAVS
jgi:hypothetical protein